MSPFYVRCERCGRFDIAQSYGGTPHIPEGWRYLVLDPYTSNQASRDVFILCKGCTADVWDPIQREMKFSLPRG